MFIVSGDDQTADPGVFLPETLVVQINDRIGQPVAYAAVTFEADNGLVGLTADSAVLNWTVTATTDVNGRAVAYFQTPYVVGYTSTISVTAQVDADYLNAQFTETTTTPPPPPAPSDVTIIRQSNGSTVVTWVSNSVDEDGFAIERQNIDGSWLTVAYTDPGASSFTLAPPTRPVADTRNIRVAAVKYEQRSYSAETNPATVRYAVIDLGPGSAVRITNSGYALLHGYYPLVGPQRWFRGNFEQLLGGDEPLLQNGGDINENGTVVGSVLLHQPGSAPASGIADCQHFDWYSNGGYGIRQAVQWPVGETQAAPIGQPSFPFHIYDCTNGRGLPYIGAAQSGVASAIDNDGHIYGSTMLDYQEHQQTAEDDPTLFLPTRFGSIVGGYDFTAGIGFGDQSLSFDGTNFITQGATHYIHRARNGITVGNDHSIFAGLGTIGYVNGAQVDFLPVNINTFGAVLCENLPSDAFDWFIYDTATTTRTELEIPVPLFWGSLPIGPFYAPLALNHRQIPAYDANGLPIVDSLGKQTTKESPQLVGIDSTFSEPMAMLWEENPKSHHYEPQYLRRLISPNSGWQIENAYDINDDGIIAGDGWYQEYDSNGDAVGSRKWRACLLTPANVRFIQPIQGAVFAFCDDVNLSVEVLGAYRDQVTRVEYWNGSEKIAESTDLNGWPATWIKPATGKYRLIAKAIVPNTLGFEESTEITITVLPISHRGAEFIVNEEAGGFDDPRGAEPYYNAFLIHPKVPTDDGQPIEQSGVTIGIGYDLGQNSGERIRTDWSPYLSADVVNRLVSAAGKKRYAAMAAQAALQDITISYNVALQVYYQKSLPRYMNVLNAAYPTAQDTINPTALGALASMIFNRGGTLSTSTKRVELVQIRDAINNNRLDLIPDLIRAMRSKVPNPSRRAREADWFETWYNSTTDPCE